VFPKREDVLLANFWKKGRGNNAGGTIRNTLPDYYKESNFPKIDIIILL
jgi:hypothetical protein